MHQGAVVPADVEVVGLEPDAVFVGDGQPPNGEVAPDVAAEPLDLQLADLPEAEPGHPRLDQQPGRRRQHPEAQHRRGQGDEQHRDEHEADRPARRRPGAHAGEAARPPRGPLGRGVRRLAQKLCPMLT